MATLHWGQLRVSARADAVAGYLLDPRRVMAYFPDAVDSGVFVEGGAIWILAKGGATRIERVAS